MIKTDDGHEFQAKFNWSVRDLGMGHVHIKSGTPRLNGKVERSRLTDRQEFYQLLDYKDDVDLSRKLAEREAFYNFHQPHSGYAGKNILRNVKKQIRFVKFLSAEVQYRTNK